MKYNCENCNKKLSEKEVSDYICFLSLWEIFFCKTCYKNIVKNTIKNNPKIPKSLTKNRYQELLILEQLTENATNRTAD